MIRAIGGLLAAAALAAGSPAAAEAADPTDAHRWHMPRRSARKLAQDVAGPEHAEWNRLGHLVNAGKEKLLDWGIRFDVDLDFFDQYASRVISGQQNLGTFSWRIMGDWKLLDFTGSEHVSPIGKGFVGWTAFGTAGLNYDPAKETLTGNVGAVNTLNATVFGQGAVLDELF